MINVNIYLFSQPMTNIKIRHSLDDCPLNNIIIKTDDDINKMIQYYHDMKMYWFDLNSTLSLFSNFELFKDNEFRIKKLKTIWEKIKQIIPEVDDRLHGGGLINFFLLTPSGDIFKISDFDKINNNIDKIQKISEDNLAKFNTVSEHLDRLKLNEKTICLGNIDKDTISEFSEKMVEEVRVSVLTKSLQDYIFDYVEKGKDIVEKSTIDSINQTRDEDDKDITNEMKIIQSIFEEFLSEDSTIESCEYNGKTIEPEALVQTLLSHMLPEYMTQVNIFDTLDDNFEITFKNGTKILRTKETYLDKTPVYRLDKTVNYYVIK